MAEVRHVKISDICNIEKGTTGLAKAIPGKYPLVTTGAECRTSVSYQFDSKAVCIPLVSSTGHGKKSLNYVHYQEGKFALGSILAAVIPKDDGVVNARYLHVYLQKNKDRVIVPLMRGAANVSLSIKAISNIGIPLPSLKKQEKTLEKIDSISEEHEDFQQEINVQAGLFKRLRQQILQEAIEGKITATWRENNPQLISGENHASRVIEKIIAKKTELVENGEIRKEKSLSVQNSADKPFDLPEGWVWCSLGQVMTIRGGKRMPQGHAFAGHQTKNIYIRIVDMKNGSILDYDNKYINEDTFKKISSYIIRCSDLYLTIAGTIGQCGLIPEKFDRMNLTENAARLTPYFIQKEWCYYALSSTLLQKQFKESTKGMAQPKLALKRIAKAYCPLPPLAEQQAIVERVDKLMHMIDMLEMQGAERKEQSEMLMQSVLKEAFEG